VRAGGLAPPITRPGQLRTGTESDRLRSLMKKSKTLPHRNRRKSARHRAKLKAKHRKARLRQSKGEKKYA